MNFVNCVNFSYETLFDYIGCQGKNLWHADHVIRVKRSMKPLIAHQLCAICQGDKFQTFLATLISGLAASVLTKGWEASFCLIFHLSTYHPSCLATPKATGPQPLLMDYHQMEANKLLFTLLRPCHPSNWDTTKVTHLQ